MNKSTSIIKIYGISNCDTVKKARVWLQNQELPHHFYDLKKNGVPDVHLHQWIDDWGWETVINRKGTTWRGLDSAVKAGVADAGSAQALAAANPSIIKRPVVEWDNSPDGRCVIGFNPELWAQWFARRQIHGAKPAEG